MKLDLDEYVSSHDIDGLKKLNLNNGFKDPSFLREKLMLDFMNEHGMAAPRCTYAKVYLNGTYWGLYMLVEEANNKFCKQRFGNDDGNRFKGDPSGDLKWLGSTPSNYYSKYELDNNETANDWSDLVHLIDEANNTPIAELHDSLETVLNTWSFAYHWAADNLFVNLDSYIGSGHNYFVYRNTWTNRFEWIHWDVNEAFGNFNFGMNISQLQNLSWNYLNQAANRPLCNRMLQDPTYQSMYVAALCDLAADFTNAALDAKIDSLANAIRSDVYADNMKFYSNQQFEDNIVMDINVGQQPGGGNIAGIKPFIGARHNALLSQLQAFGCWLGTNELTKNETVGSYPNPFSSSCTLELPAGWNASDCTLQLSDLSGRDVSGCVSLGREGEKLLLRRNALPPGMYLASISRQGGSPLHVRLIVSD